MTNDIEILVSWKGFSENDNSWESLKNLYEDVRTQIQSYATKLRKQRHELAFDVTRFIEDVVTPVPVLTHDWRSWSCS